MLSKNLKKGQNKTGKILTIHYEGNKSRMINRKVKNWFYCLHNLFPFIALGLSLLFAEKGYFIWGIILYLIFFCFRIYKNREMLKTGLNVINYKIDEIKRK